MLQSLRAHLDLANRKESSYKDVCIVEISFHDHAKWDQPVRRVSDLLLRIPSIDTLIINLQNLSKLNMTRLFRRITLPNLQNFAFRNIHHSAVTDFILRHHTLASISIGCCVGGCDLSTLSGSQQQLDIKEITGPSACIAGLVSWTTQALHVTWDPSNTSEGKDTALFSRVQAVQANVRVLSTQFFPEDLGFTGRLSDVFRQLSSLKLVEAPRQNALVSSLPIVKACL